LTGLAAILLRDSEFYAATVAASQELAQERLGYPAVSRQLARFFDDLSKAA
jgi:hypothetical protein